MFVITDEMGLEMVRIWRGFIGARFLQLSTACRLLITCPENLIRCPSLPEPDQLRKDRLRLTSCWH